MISARRPCTPRRFCRRPLRTSAQRGFLTGSTHREWHRQSCDPLQNRCEQLSRHGDLRQLEEHVLRVPRYFSSDLDQLFPKRRQGPVPYRFRQGEPPQEVAQVVMLSFDGSAPDDTRPPFPPLPEAFTTNEPELWTALREATTSTDPNPTRYALSCIQFRGSEGKLIATDSQQLLVQSGFTFPWTEDLLVPASNVFGCRELRSDQPIDVGKTDDWATPSSESLWFIRWNSTWRTPRMRTSRNRPQRKTMWAAVPFRAMCGCNSRTCLHWEQPIRHQRSRDIGPRQEFVIGEHSPPYNSYSAGCFPLRCRPRTRPRCRTARPGTPIAVECRRCGDLYLQARHLYPDRNSLDKSRPACYVGRNVAPRGPVQGFERQPPDDLPAAGLRSSERTLARGYRRAWWAQVKTGTIAKGKMTWFVRA